SSRGPLPLLASQTALAGSQSPGRAPGSFGSALPPPNRASSPAGEAPARHSTNRNSPRAAAAHTATTSDAWRVHSQEFARPEILPSVLPELRIRSPLQCLDPAGATNSEAAGSAVFCMTASDAWEREPDGSALTIRRTPSG